MSTLDISKSTFILNCSYFEVNFLAPEKFILRYQYLSIRELKYRKCVQTIFFDINDNFAISVFDITRGKFIYNMISPDRAIQS